MSSREFKSFDELNRKLKKSVLLSGQARHALLAGITAVADVARVTLGPTGRAVCFGNDGTPPLLTCDGVTVAENITLPNRHHNIGAQLLKQAATATRDKAGDGSTTTVVLAQELIREGLKLITAGANPMVFRRGLVKGAAAVQAALERMKRPVTTMAELQQIATAAANDPEIGQLVSQMISRLGPQGFINIQDGSGLGFQVEYHPGCRVHHRGDHRSAKPGAHLGPRGSPGSPLGWIRPIGVFHAGSLARCSHQSPLW